jgi:PAS domain S-box-containing protein
MATELQENQSKLEERRRYIETILLSLSTGVISLDEQNRVTTINAAAIEMLQLDYKASENHALTEIINEDNRETLEKLITRARRFGSATEQTVFFRQKHVENGKSAGDENASIPVALAATALRGNSGKNFGVVLVIEDLSELISAQRAAAWQEVARRMAHEIKNPLTPIQLAAERIHKNFQRFSNGETANGKIQYVVDESTSIILREVNGLKSMVNEFSHFARLPHPKLENADLNEVVRQTLALYEDRFADVLLESELQENLPPAMLDSEQMRRVFVNLIDNAAEAFQASQSDKRILVKTWHAAATDSIFVEIADNGRGISGADFAKLFQPYFSTKGRGTGLGLAIVQRIITEHGGRIRAASNLPKGTRFTVELPIANV